MAQKNKEVNPRLGKAGGQALMEGIMMNGPEGAAMSVRKTDGSIITVPKEFTHVRDKVKFLGLPVIRGIVNFVESMLLGYKCLMESAELSGQLELEETEEEMSKLDKWLSDHFGPKMMAVISGIAMVLGVALSFILFVYVPSILVRLFDTHVLGDFMLNNAMRPLVEGIIRIGIFIGYLAAVTNMKDIKRVFMYHGAEHKTIFCYEAGEELTVENVKKYSRFHPRCGTSFMFIMLIFSILASSVLAVILKQFPGLMINGVHILNVTWAWSIIKVLILPIVMGVGYEFLKFSGKYSESKIMKVLIAPGLWMQRLTTKEPEDDMIEVGITALKAVTEGIPEEEGTGKTDEETESD